MVNEFVIVGHMLYVRYETHNIIVLIHTNDLIKLHK